MFSFQDKTALIFGAGQNIGQAVAFEYARRGARVAVADINGPGAEETAAAIIQSGGRAIGVAADVTSEESIAAAVAATEAALGAVDILMNNAGIIHNGNPEDFPPAEWIRMFDVNFFGAVRANALLMPKMIARRSGYIVNTASFAGLYPFATSRVPYAASKAALVSMSENLALHLLPLGVRVSCLCPGPTMTTSTAGMKSWSQNVVMKGPGSDLSVKSQEEAATILADGMEKGRVLILTHERGFDTVRERGASPDGFIQHKIDEFARGQTGRPGR